MSVPEPGAPGQAALERVPGSNVGAAAPPAYPGREALATELELARAMREHLVRSSHAAATVRAYERD